MSGILPASMNVGVTKKEITDLTKRIVRTYKPERIVLFGSFAWGTPGPDSDVDLLVVKSTRKPRLERTVELRKRVFPPRIPFDVLVYTPSELERKIHEDGNLFLADIVKHGRVLYARRHQARR